MTLCFVRIGFVLLLIAFILHGFSSSFSSYYKAVVLSCLAIRFPVFVLNPKSFEREKYIDQHRLMGRVASL